MNPKHIVDNRMGRLFNASALALAIFVASASSAIAGQSEDLILTIPEGAAKPASLSADVAKWRGSLGNGDVVYVDSLKREQPSGFGSMVVLNFDSHDELAAWKKANAKSLAAPFQARETDVLTEGGKAPAPGTKPVYKISYYKPTASREAIQAWVDGYLTKYLDVQIEKDILTRYGFYLEDGQDGRLVLVLEYKDAKTEHEAEPIKAAASDAIAKVNKEYARQAELKESLRTTQSWTLAVPAK